MSVMDIGEPNPITARVCAQIDLVQDCDDETDALIPGTEREQTCGRHLVFEKHGDEVVYMCVEHGWQATVFEQGSDNVPTVYETNSDAPTPQ
jgi:hypothetical protein